MKRKTAPLFYAFLETVFPVRKEFSFRVLTIALRLSFFFHKRSLKDFYLTPVFVIFQ